MFLFKIMKHIFVLLLQPKGLKLFGKNSRIYLPYKINRKQHVYIGNNTLIHKSSLINPIVKNKSQVFNPEICIGNNVYIGSYAQLHAMNKIIIGNNSVISDYVYINDALHSIEPMLDNIMDGNFYSKGTILIGEGCFIGYDVAILSGVAIGRHCIIATKSVVTKSFPDYMMIAGNPAIAIKRYCNLKNKWIKL